MKKKLLILLFLGLVYTYNNYGAANFTHIQGEDGSQSQLSAELRHIRNKIDKATERKKQLKQDLENPESNYVRGVCMPKWTLREIDIKKALDKILKSKSARNKVGAAARKRKNSVQSDEDTLKDLEKLIAELSSDISSDKKFGTNLFLQIALKKAIEEKEALVAKMAKKKNKGQSEDKLNRLKAERQVVKVELHDLIDGLEKYTNNKSLISFSENKVIAYANENIAELNQKIEKLNIEIELMEGDKDEK